MSLSIMLLWIFMILQMIVMFALIRLVVDFLNRFKVENGLAVQENSNEQNIDIDSKEGTVE